MSSIAMLYKAQKTILRSPHLSQRCSSRRTMTDHCLLGPSRGCRCRLSRRLNSDGTELSEWNPNQPQSLSDSINLGLRASLQVLHHSSEARRDGSHTRRPIFAVGEFAFASFSTRRRTARTLFFSNLLSSLQLFLLYESTLPTRCRTYLSSEI